MPLYSEQAYKLYSGERTRKNPTGFQGRVGIYEVMDITQEVEDLIIQTATSGQINEMGVQQGMVTMRQDGYLKALSGVTTLEEVNRVASDIV